MTERDLRIDLRQVDADVAAEHGEGQVGGAGLIGVGHRRVGMLLERQRMRPAVLDRVAHPVQRADAGIAAPGEDQLVDGAHADQLVVDQVRRHAADGQVLAALADDLMAGGEGDEVGEALHRDGIAVAEIGLDRVVQGQEFGQATAPYFDRSS